MNASGGGTATLACCVLLSLGATLAQAQSAPRVYSCKDAHGRILSADRPIADCADREQEELRKSGGVLRKVAPTYSDLDLVTRDRQDREAEQQVLQRAGERRRERALLVRYPDARIHEQERADALAQIDQALQLARNYLAALKTERHKLDEELAFYRGDRAKAPAALDQKFDENDSGIQAQTRFIQSSEEERQRVIQRFESERAQLEPQWQARASRR